MSFIHNNLPGRNYSSSGHSERQGQHTLPRIAFVVNGQLGGALDQRARTFAGLLSGRYDVRLAHRSPQKLAAILHFLLFLVRVRPAVSYVFDMSYSGVAAAALYKFFFRNRLVIETGDAIYELARDGGLRRGPALWLTWLLEKFSLRIADRIVVRGRFHQRHLAGRGVAADVIQDGVHTAQFAPSDVSALRRELGLGGVLTVGLVGTSIWSERLQWCYGRELVEAIRLLKDLPVVGLMIGDGPGIERLKKLCREYGISDRVRFWGYLPYDELPPRLGLMDICLSTQTNNLVGQVRTTGKLPLYLAAGRYVLASAVGEALMILPPEMLVPYEGNKDEFYPRRLADRIRLLARRPAALRRREEVVVLAKRHFEYRMLAERLDRVLASVIGRCDSIGQEAGSGELIAGVAMDSLADQQVASASSSRQRGLNLAVGETHRHLHKPTPRSGG